LVRSPFRFFTSVHAFLFLLLKRERALALIDIAHPDLKGELRACAGTSTWLDKAASGDIVAPHQPQRPSRKQVTPVPYSANRFSPDRY